MADMGILYTTVLIESHSRRGDLRSLPDTLVDTGAELTWAPRAVMEDLGIGPRSVDPERWPSRAARAA